MEITENPAEVDIQTYRQGIRVQKLFDQLDVDWRNVNDTDKGSLKQLVEIFSDVFAIYSKVIGHTESIQHKPCEGELRK